MVNAEQNDYFLNSELPYPELAKAIVSLGVNAVEKANSGHPGAVMGMSDFVTVLFAKYLRFSAKYPNWLLRDRFILSNGHGSMLLYAVLYLTGYEKPTLKDIENFRQLGSVCAGHPEYGHLQGVEVTTGPLGQGLANSVGMAIAQKKSGHSTSKVYVTVGDGCLMEGISHEAASLAGHLGLNNLIVLFDDNEISIDGAVSLSDSTDTKKRFESYGWRVIKANGHDYDDIEKAFDFAVSNGDKPTLIMFRTIIGKHANLKKGKETSHGAPLGKEELIYVKKFIGYEDYEPFELPQNVLNAWRTIGSKNDDLFNFDEMDKKFVISTELQDRLNVLRENSFTYTKDESTRKSSGEFLKNISSYAKGMIGGSADLSESNCTKTSFSVPITKNNFNGNFIHYGIREHAMTAIANGIACYGNAFLPFTSGFLIFSDYAKPAIRLSALMGIQTIQILTHDSIGLGEDGPTHQPIEQLAGLRAIPNVLVFRPGDAFEMHCAWQIAMLSYNKPSIIVCSRQNLKQLPKLCKSDEIFQSICESGSYIVKDFDSEKVKVDETFNDLMKKMLYSNEKTNVNVFDNGSIEKILFLSSGSEVSLALEVANRLEEQSDITTRVISVVSTNLLSRNKSSIKKMIDYDSLELIVAIEAGSRFGWDEYLRPNDLFIGMDDIFGASGKGEDLYRHFGLMATPIYEKIVDFLESRGKDVMEQFRKLNKM